MPPKKKGKGSKLARMSEEEKARYLQHRAELELEAKRRKQQLIAAFTKNKLKREEAFARLNNAKINEQWRFQLRQIKCKELYEDLEYLWTNFDRSLRARDATIAQLFQDLEKADIDHRRLEEVHTEMIDQYIERYQQSLQALADKYEESIAEIREEGLGEMSNAKNQLLQAVKHLETIVFAQHNALEDTALETKTRNAIYTRTIEYSKNEISDDLKRCVGGKIRDLWSKLNEIIANYQTSTENKRKEYETMKERDYNFYLESIEFPRQQFNLLESIKTLKIQENTLEKTRKKKINELSDQLELLDKQNCKLRQEFRINQTVDAISLKRLSVASRSAVRDLRTLRDKGNTLITLMKICHNFEPAFSMEKNIPIKNTNAGDANAVVIDPYVKLENFWKQYNLVKTDTILLKREQNLLMVENDKLKHSLRSYLTTVAKIPNFRPQTVGSHCRAFM